MQGSCHCGQVVFQVGPPLRPVIACHCSQCRKQSGHFWAASSVPLTAFHLQRAATLVWYAASPQAQRGFCSQCGAFLFWQATGSDQISFAAGCLDGPTGLTIAESWHEEHAGDYYLGPQSQAETLHGACLCGANRFTAPGPMGAVTACHCTQCRKLSGHFAASFDIKEEQLTWTTRHTAEYRTPAGGQRGFCPGCGSSLYFRASNGDFSVEAGSIDNPTGGHLAAHIFTAFKGDYYRLDDGLPQSLGSGTEGTQA